MAWFRRRRDQRTPRKPPLQPEYEAYARRLAVLGTSVLDRDSNEAEAVEIGRRLNSTGGMPLMVAVAERADAISVERGGGRILRHLEYAWNGIGEWRA